MSLVFPLDRALKITPQNSGNIAEFGAAGFGTSVGTWLIDFVPDSSWDGGLALLCRVSGEDGSDANVALVPCPYRAIYLNNASPAIPYGWDVQPIISRSIVQVPSNGLSIGVLINCTAGFGWLYSRNLDGPSAP